MQAGLSVLCTEIHGLPNLYIRNSLPNRYPEFFVDAPTSIGVGRCTLSANFRKREFSEIRAQHVRLASCSLRASLKQGGHFR
jgi:hypothetical protein